MQTFGLALSGGAAKGLCHVRVYEKLLENKIKINAVSGASAGALFGAMIAIGYSPNNILKIINGKEFQNLIKYKFLSLNFNMFNPFAWKCGLFKLDRLKNYLNDEVFKNARIEDLDINLAIAYTNVDRNITEYFTKGNIAEAVCHSICFPLIFKSMNNCYYDGGLKCNCPTGILKSKFNVDHILAIDVTNISKNDAMYKHSIFDYVNRIFDVIWTDTFTDDLELATWVISPNINQSIGFFDFDKYNMIKDRVDILFNDEVIKLIKSKIG